MDAEIIWEEGPGGNVEHISENGVTQDEVEDVLDDPNNNTVKSRSSKRPITFGWTQTGKHIAVVWEEICENQRLIYPVTAYDHETTWERNWQKRRQQQVSTATGKNNSTRCTVGCLVGSWRGKTSLRISSRSARRPGLTPDLSCLLHLAHSAPTAVWNDGHKGGASHVLCHCPPRQVYTGQHIQHMQKALEQMNVKLTEVVSDITGVTGMAIIKAILRGERDPLVLAKYRNEHCKRSEEEIALALYGNWREDHLFELEQAVSLYDLYQKHLDDCDAKLKAYLESLDDRSGGKKPTTKSRQRKRKGNEPNFDTRSLLHRFSGVDLTILEGVEATTALAVLSEIGTDMSKWPSVKHFVSWLGLCPIKEESGGKDRGRRRRRRANRAARALRLAAQGCHHAKNALGAFCRRIQARCGGPKAVVATARKIAERVYRLLKYGEEYVRQDMAAYEESYREWTWDHTPVAYV